VGAVPELTGEQVADTAGLSVDESRRLWRALGFPEVGEAAAFTTVDAEALVKVADIEKTEAWFLRHGTKAVFFGRMIPVFRSLISVPAGVERMPLPVFLGLTTLGSALWNTAFVCAGYLLGDNWAEVTTVVSAYSKVVLIGAAAALAAFIAVRVMRQRPKGARGTARPATTAQQRPDNPSQHP
jgi:hypothetical protein